MSNVITGPMVGEVSENAALIWFEADAEGVFTVQVIDEHNNSKPIEAKRSLPGVFNFFPYYALVPNLNPEKSYTCRIQEKTVAFTTFPKPGTIENFSFITGSCASVNDYSIDSDYCELKIFDLMAGVRLEQDPPEKAAKFNLWLGDNIYIMDNAVENAANSTIESDTLMRPDGMVDLSFYKARHRYSIDRHKLEIQSLLKARPNFAIWDNHDFGSDNPTFKIEERHRRDMVNLFKAYWPALEDPTAYATDPDHPHLFHKFRYSDCEFFLMDNRYARAKDYGERNGDKDPYFGEMQLDWLNQELNESKATFKFIANGNQVLNPILNQGSPLIRYYREHRRLIDEIIQDVKGVVFLTGDLHNTEVMQLELQDSKKKVCEFTSSPITAKAYDRAINSNSKIGILPSELGNRQNYGLITVRGKEGNREIYIQAKGIEARKDGTRVFFDCKINEAGDLSWNYNY
jgi:alkaline phosphatase D